MTKLLVYILIGGVIGAALGYFGKCTSGACPFTANPFRGAGFGALFGLLFGLASTGNPFQKREMIPDSPAILHVQNDSELDALIKSATVPVLVDFYADWCGPCRKLAPELSSVADRWKDNARIVKINVDLHRDIASRFGVSSIPDMRIFSGGVEKDKIVGFHNRSQLNALLLAAGGVLPTEAAAGAAQALEPKGE